MTEAKGSVTGAHQEHQVKFYGLSTCIWCRKTREFLEEERSPSISSTSICYKATSAMQ